MANKSNSEMDFDSNNSSDYEEVLNSTMSDEVSGRSNDSDSAIVMPEAFKHLQDYLDRKLANLDKLNKIDNLEKMLRNNIKHHDTRLSKLETDNERLKQQVEKLARDNEQLSRDNEQLTKETRSRNLIIHGLVETEAESSTSLNDTVRKLFHTITQKEIPIDVAYRLGVKKENVTRHVRVSLHTQSDRNVVYENRMKTGKGVFINEDLHKNTRRDMALLRRKKKELSDQQIKCNINYNNLTLKTESGESFCVRDGKLSKAEQPSVSTSSLQQNSKNGRGNKRKVSHVPDPDLIGKENLRMKGAKVPKTGN